MKIKNILQILLTLGFLTGIVCSQSIRRVETFSPAAGNASSNEVAVVNSTGLVYNYGQAFGNNIGVIDPATNTLIKSIRPTDPNNTSNSFYSRVNQTTDIVYFLQEFSAGKTILPIDARPASPTFNQALPVISFTNQTIVSFAIDQARGRLYATTRTLNSSPAQSQIQIVDINPANPTFNQAIGSAALPSGQQAGAVAVNSVTNKIYVTSASSNGGVFVLNGATQNLTLIAGTLGAGGVIVNEATNMVYAGKATISPFGIFIIDGVTDTPMKTVSLPSFITSNFNDYIAVNSTSGRIYLVSSNNTLSVLDGDRSSANFNSIIANIPNVGNGRIGLDEGTNKIVVGTSTQKTTIVDGATNTIAATTFANMTSQDVAVNPVTHRAYIAYVFYTTQAINLNDNSYINIGTASEIGESIINPNNNFFYFPRNQSANDIAFLNTNDTIGLVTGVPHGFGRYLFAAQNTVTNRIYVANSSSNLAGTDTRPGFVSVIDGATNNVITNVEIGAQPFTNPAVNEVTNKIYVPYIGFSNVDPSRIAVIDGATNTRSNVDTSAFPANTLFYRTIVANPLTNRIYFRVGEGATVGVVNGATNVATPLPGITNVSNILVNTNLNRVYFLTSTGVRVLNGADDTEIANIALPGASSFAINQTTGRIFVRSFQSQQNHNLTAIDGNTNAVVSTVTLSNSLSTIAINEVTNRLYIGTMTDFNDESTSNILFMNGNTLAIEKTLPIPLSPGRISVNAATKTVYVTTVNAQVKTGLVVISDDTAATAAGSNVNVSPNGGVNLTFANVASAGNTTATALSPTQLPALPFNFSLIGSPVMYDISTTATFTGSIKVSFNVPNVANTSACSQLRILHFTNNDWDISGNAAPVYNSSNQTCLLSQTVASLSPFVVVQSNPPANAEQCKNGGWTKFDTPRRFKNQGECIQFVNTGK